MPYTLLKTGSLPIEIMAIKWVVEYMLKVQNSPSHQLLRIAWEASKKIQKTHKRKFSYSHSMQDMKKWFGEWNATLMIHDVSIDFSMDESSCIEAFCSTNVSWDGKNVEAHASHIILHMLHLTTKSYSLPNGKTTCQYMLEDTHCLSFKPLLPCDLAHM